VGRAATRKRTRREAPPPTNKAADAAKSRRRLIWMSVVIPALIVAAIVAVLLARNSTPAPPPAAAPSRADSEASPQLISAADAVGFHPTTEPGVGQIEDKPASDAQPPSNSDLVAVGSRAPAFSLKTPEGDSVSLSDYRGKAVLLEFFATWCPHCNAEAPHLQALASSLGQKRFAFLSVNADSEDAASVFAYHRYFGLSFPALLDPGSPAGNFHQQGGPGPVTQAYGVQSYPTFYIVDGTGRIAWASDGEQPDALLRKNLVAAASASG